MQCQNEMHGKLHADSAVIERHNGSLAEKNLFLFFQVIHPIRSESVPSPMISSWRLSFNHHVRWTFFFSRAAQPGGCV